MQFSEYISTLGALVYDRECADIPEGFAAQLLDDGIAGVMLWKKSEECRQLSDYQRLNQFKIWWGGKVVFHKLKLKQFTESMQHAKIRFALIKGGDLVFRVYPFETLRRFDDWDVLIHYDDWNRAREVLQSAGWRVSNWEITDGHHHASHVSKEGIRMEPHWTLPMFEGVSSEEIWREIRPVSDGSSQYVLTPELNILLLCRHLGECKYQYSKFGRFLMDAAYLLKCESVDWSRLRGLCSRWHLPYPGNLLGAFGEFFPQDLRESFQANEELARQYRFIFEHRDEFASCSALDIQFASLSFMQRIRRWFAGLSFSRLRNKYSLPENTSFLKMCSTLVMDLFNKAKQLLTRKKSGDSGLAEYLRAMELTEESDK